MTTARASRSAGSTWSPIPAPISTRPSTAIAEGADLGELDLAQLAALPGLVVPVATRMAVDADAFDGLDVAGKAVLVQTGWDRHWRTDAYQRDHPFLTEAAARLLVARGARLVGIDSHNIDDTRARARPVHTSCSAPAS